MTTAQEQLFKPYSVGGEQINAEQIAKALRVLQRDRFALHNLAGALFRAGVSWDNSDRAADRLLQRARKLGLCVFGQGTWGVTLQGFPFIAQAIEARSGETAKHGSTEGESAVPKGCAQ